MNKKNKNIDSIVTCMVHIDYSTVICWASYMYVFYNKKLK